MVPSPPMSADRVLPAAFVERLPRIVPADALDGVLASFDVERAVGLRANSLRGEPDATWAALADAGVALRIVPGLEHARLASRESLRSIQDTQVHGRGAVFVQGLSSQLAAPALAPGAGERVLDMAAAPGGKSAHLAALMGDDGALLANDRSRPRTYKLRAVLELLGVSCADVSCRPGEGFGASHPGVFDRVLLDAPCSGEARLEGRVPDATERVRKRGRDRAGLRDGWSLARVRRLAGLQRRLLHAGLDALRPGGQLVYATCTFGPEENEAVLDHVLRRRDDARLLPVERPPWSGLQDGLTTWNERELLPELAGALRVLPDAEREAFFLARVERLGG